MRTKKSFKKSLITSSVLATFACASNLHAFVVDETTDYSNSFFDTGSTEINMPGITTLTGSTSVLGDTLDNFKILGLPTGMQTINYSITLEGADPFSQIYIYADYANGNVNTRSNDPVEDFENEGTFDRTFETNSDFNGILRFEITGFQRVGSGTISYSIELPTAPVPVPAAALLFASGLGALGAAKARRKAKRRA